MTFKLGILLPQSKQYPTMGRDFVDGLELALGNTPVQLHVEGIGIGADPKQTIDAIQKLQLQHRVHLITGLLGHNQMERLHQQIVDLDAVLLSADLGATLPHGLPQTPNVFCNSFDLAHSSLLAAQQMAANGHTKVAVSTCFYDSGYGFMAALDKGLSQTSAQFAGHFITPHMPRPNESELMSEFVSATTPDVVYAQYSGIFAREHATFLQQNGLTRQLPLYASHFAVEEALLDEFPSLFDGVRCITSWMTTDDAPANRQFVDAFMDAYDRSPSVFALLGYENGRAIAAVQASAPKYTPADIKRALASVNFDGPRGTFAFHPQTHRTAFDQHEWLIEARDGGYQKTKTARLSVSSEQTAEMMKTPPSTMGGWHNAYLCH